MNAHVETTLQDYVLTIRLSRPDKKNALTQDMYDAVCAALTSAASGEARAVLLAGSGGNFTSGNDLADFQQVVRQGTGLGELPLIRFLHQVVDFPKPLVAAVEGNAIGIGTTVLMHCDLVLAASDATFALPFVPLGLVPEFASSYLLPRMAGHAAAARALMLGEPFDAEQAQQLGIVGEVCATSDLGRRAAAVCARLAALPPESLLETKTLMKPEAERRRLHGIIDTEAAAFARRLASPEHRAAVEAFFASRR